MPDSLRRMLSCLYIRSSAGPDPEKPQNKLFEKLVDGAHFGRYRPWVQIVMGREGGAVWKGARGQTRLLPTPPLHTINDRYE